jgi:hypothetical protein
MYSIMWGYSDKKINVIWPGLYTPGSQDRSTVTQDSKLTCDPDIVYYIE